MRNESFLCKQTFWINIGQIFYQFLQSGGSKCLCGNIAVRINKCNSILQLYYGDWTIWGTNNLNTFALKQMWRYS